MNFTNSPTPETFLSTVLRNYAMELQAEGRSYSRFVCHVYDPTLTVAETLSVAPCSEDKAGRWPPQGQSFTVDL